MITQETAARIFNCYREIEAAKKLLEDTEKAQQQNLEKGLSRDAPTVKDAFGQKRNLELTTSWQVWDKDWTGRCTKVYANDWKTL